MKSCRYWWSASIVTQTHWGYFPVFLRTKLFSGNYDFCLRMLCSGNETFMCFVHSAVCQCECFITHLAPARLGPSSPQSACCYRLSAYHSQTQPLCYRQCGGYAEVLKGRINPLIRFAAFWTLFILFPVNEIQSLCDSRDTRSLAVLQQRLGMETWSHKYGLEPHCQGHSTFPEQNDTPGKRI